MFIKYLCLPAEIDIIQPEEREEKFRKRQATNL